MRTPFADSPEFRRLIGDSPEEADLARVALEVASDAYPGLDPEPYLARLDGMAERVKARGPLPGRPHEVLGRINWALFVEEEFRGNSDDYYDPRNSYLNEVIDRKTGIPITLSLIYWRVAEGVGLPLTGANLPGHFMLRSGEGPAAIYVDPFHGGALLGRDACERQLSRTLGRRVTLSPDDEAPCGKARFVARMLGNLKAIHGREGDLPAAFAVQRRLAALHAEDPEEQRDLGVIALRLNRPADAIAPLERFLDARPDAPGAEELRRLLKTARREVSQWN